jgi:hypothetical protein
VQVEVCFVVIDVAEQLTETAVTVGLDGVLPPPLLEPPPQPVIIAKAQINAMKTQKFLAFCKQIFQLFVSGIWLSPYPSLAGAF